MHQNAMNEGGASRGCLLEEQVKDTDCEELSDWEEFSLPSWLHSDTDVKFSPGPMILYLTQMEAPATIHLT